MPGTRWTPSSTIDQPSCNARSIDARTPTRTLRVWSRKPATIASAASSGERRASPAAKLRSIGERPRDVDHVGVQVFGWSRAGREDGNAPSQRTGWTQAKTRTHNRPIDLRNSRITNGDDKIRDRNAIGIQKLAQLLP